VSFVFILFSPGAAMLPARATGAAHYNKTSFHNEL
jgi:hypothetical protein